MHAQPFNKARLEETRFSIFAKPITNNINSDLIDIFSIYEWIRDGYKKSTLVLRSLTDKSEMSEYKKTNFHCVTFSGTFSTRKDDGLLKHSNLICIDIDGLPPVKLRRIKNFIKADPSLVMLFVSPSGNGLKAIYPIDITVATHDEWYTAYIKHVTESCYLDAQYIDTSCRNVSRACFINNDPGVFLNPNIDMGNDIFPIDLIQQENPQISYESDVAKLFLSAPSSNIAIDIDNRDSEDNFLALITINEKKHGPYSSPREPWIQKLASLCNILGMSQNRCLELVLKHFQQHPESTRVDKPIDVKNVLNHPVNDTYKRYSQSFGTWTAISTITNEEDFNSKLFPENMYSNLPTYLKTLCNEFTGRDRDVFLISFLGVVSPCFSPVVGIYDDYTMRSNLYIFIAAPASAGKSPMRWARELIKPIDKELKEASEALIEDYKRSHNDYQNGITETHPGKRPKQQSLLIAANNSATGILQNIANNKEVGLIFETEADTLSGTLSKEWGDFSEFLRKAFQHEPFSYNRRGGNEHVEVESPQLSVVLSGTPQQVINLIPNTENGLFSRFGFYAFNLDAKWKDVFARRGAKSRELFFKEQAEQLFQYYKWVQEEANIEFSFTEEQQKKFNHLFEKSHDEFANLMGLEIIPTIRRLGLTTFRIAMLLSIFRKLEEGMLCDKIICADCDFDSALAMNDVIKDHAAYVYQSYKGNAKIDLKSKPLEFYQLLPATFNRAAFLELANSIGIIPKTAESYITQFITKKYLIRKEHNHYVKANS
jgi:hypothetical protein